MERHKFQSGILYSVFGIGGYYLLALLAIGVCIGSTMSVSGISDSDR